MIRLSKSKLAKYQIITVGITLIVLKLLKAVSFNWIITLSPFIILIFIELIFIVCGYVMYGINKRKND